MRKIFTGLGLFFFFAVLIFTKFYKLGEAPQTLIIDEAHYAYLSYSILETGKDEHGISYPIVFKGFGDYKLPAQVYLSLPFIKLFGMNNFAIKFLSALSGIILVFVVYLLFREWKFSKKSAVFASFLTAVSPWTFIMSRFAYEANLALLFFVLAILFIFKAKNKKKMLFFFLSAFFFAASLYSYVIYKFISIFFVFFFFIYFFFFAENKSKKKAFYFLISFLILIAPFFYGSGTGSNLARFKQVGILSNTQLIDQINENRHFCLQNNPKEICYLFFNKGFSFVFELLTESVKIYSPGYLFISGDDQLLYMNVENTGLFLITLLPAFVFGLLIFFKKFFEDKKKIDFFYIFILFGLIISPIPAVLSGVQKIRISALFIFILPILVLAYQFLLDKFKRKFLFNLLVFIFIAFNFIFYFVDFIDVHVTKKDYYYDAFVKEIFDYTQWHTSNNEVDKIFIQKFFSDPIMYHAYYEKVDPAVYQKDVILGEMENSGFQHAVSLGKYKVVESDPESLACAAYQEGKNSLYVTNSWKKESHLVKTIKSNFNVLNYAFIIDLNSYGEELMRGKKCQ